METKNEAMVQTLVAAVLSAVDTHALLAEAVKRGLSEVKAVTDEALVHEANERGLLPVWGLVTDAALLAEAQRRDVEFANWSDEGVREEAEKRGLLRVNLDAVTRWLEREASGNEKREVVGLLPAHMLAEVLVEGGNADRVLGEMDDDDLWEVITDKDWVVQTNIGDLDEDALFESLGDGVKEDWCEEWWKNSKRELLAECDDGELWEAIDNKDQYKGEANAEAVERVLTDCDTDGLIVALGVIAKRLRGW